MGIDKQEAYKDYYSCPFPIGQNKSITRVETVLCLSDAHGGHGRDHGGDHAASMKINTLGSKEKLWEDEKGIPLLKSDGIAIKHINGPLFFGSTDGFQKLAKEISEEANKMKVIPLTLDCWVVFYC